MVSVDSAEKTPLRILAVVQWYPPAYKAGGPIRSVHNLVQLLQREESVSVEVVCGVSDLGDNSPLPGINANQWVRRENVSIRYQSNPSPWFWWKKLQGNINEPRPDIVYLNSVFGLSFSIVPMVVSKLFGIRVLLAPRGMLGEGALAIKRKKKKAFLFMAKALGLYKGIAWHASTAQEKKEIQAVFSRPEVKVALNLPHPATECANPSWDETQHWLMLGRIQRKKNFHFALQALQNVALRDKKIVVELVGPAEDEGYLTSLLAFKKEGVRVVYAGAKPPERLKEVWERTHAMLLPTQHENFGHVVLESWAHGRLVMLSNQTPWQGLEGLEVGWDLPLVLRDWTDAMQVLVDLTEEEWLQKAKQCRHYHARVLANPELVQSNLALFLEG